MIIVFDQMTTVNVSVCLKLTAILSMLLLAGKPKSRSVETSEEDREKV